MKHAYKRFPHVKMGWDANLAYLEAYPGSYFSQIREYLREHKPERFRIHVGGDFTSQDHVDQWIETAEKYRKTRFVAFTKRYTFDFSKRTKNFSVLMSRWPGLVVPETVDLSKFAQVFYYDPSYQMELWGSYTAEDLRMQEGAPVCPGSCVNCSWCWDAGPGDVLLLPKH